jgi:hypothetical protein
LERFHAIKAERSINMTLKQSKAFKNPDILEKLITFCEINEIGSNYPKDIFDPMGFHPSDFYDELGSGPLWIFLTCAQRNNSKWTWREFKQQKWEELWSTSQKLLL